MRTDRTAICLRCALRTSPGHCPSCGESGLLDLGNRLERSTALVRLRRRQAYLRQRAASRWLTGLVTRASGRVFLPLAALATLVGGVLGGFGGAMLFLIYALTTFVGLVTFAFAAFGVMSLAQRAADVLRPGTRGIRLGVSETPLLPVDVDRIVGRVTVVDPIESPLHHERCVGFRLVGEGPRGPIDDAGAVTFEVRGEDKHARVSGAVTLEIPVPKEARTVRMDARLRRFLEERGVFPEHGSVRLSEGVVREGDLVEVVGKPEKRIESDGYRGQRTVWVFDESAGGTVRVRMRE
ncbi:MAG: hypothetical protein AAGF12_11525 [Myxococcota bacterium]